MRVLLAAAAAAAVAAGAYAVILHGFTTITGMLP